MFQTSDSCVASCNARWRDPWLCDGDERSDVDDELDEWNLESPVAGAGSDTGADDDLVSGPRSAATAAAAAPSDIGCRLSTAIGT